MSGSNALSSADVQRLLANPSVAARAETAEKLARGFDRSALTPEEQQIAVEILRLMARDAEVQVRRALAEHLRTNPDVPHDVARQLAGDVDQVAMPMLQFSPVLTDADLIAILQEGQPNKQISVAKRVDLRQGPKTTESGGVTGRFTLVRGIPARACAR